MNELNKKVIVHLKSITTPDDFHSRIKEALGFPDFYGKNFDAFIDCLSSVEEGEGMMSVFLVKGESLVLELRGWKEFEENTPEIAKSFKECVVHVNTRLDDYGDENKIELIKK